ncbi:MAG: hypothetical protein KUL79_12575 [Thauera sp.]|nr:hypothetical protein [Thauera sp.]
MRCAGEFAVSGLRAASGAARARRTGSIQEEIIDEQEVLQEGQALQGVPAAQVVA